MRRREFLVGVGVGSAAGVAGCSDVLSSGGSGPAGPPRLTVDGRWLTDPAGHRVVLRGVNLPGPVWGTEQAESRGKGYWETLDLATDADAGWHSHVLRIPATPQTLANVGVEQFAEDYLDEVVSRAAERGVYVLIDYHAIERYDTQGIDERLRAFWDTIAPRYADQSHVLYELFNEPTEPASGGLDTWRTWRETAQPWVDLVRDHAPDTPIVVGSPRWSSMTQYATDAPFEDDNVVYSAHIYPSWEPDTWEGTFGTATLDVPVFVTEWGYVDNPNADSHMVGTTTAWGNPFEQWLDAPENVSWWARAFDSRWVPPMFDTDWNVLGGDAYMGSLVKHWLAAASEDHWPPKPAGAPSPTSVEAGVPPDPPESLGVASIDDTSAKLAWMPPSDPDGDDILQYRLVVDDGEPAVLRGSVTAHLLTGLESGQSYTVSLSAVDAQGLESAPATAEFSTSRPTDAAAVIPRTQTAPAIDGSVDGVWDRAPSHRLEYTPWGTDESDLGASWRALWDESALYVLVDVSDGELLEHDAVEVYLDLDHSQDESYDGSDDLQVVFVPEGSQALQGANSAGVAAVDGATTETDDGWHVELAVPWDAYDVRPLTGRRFGMDVHAVDDVAGGSNRDAKVVWHDKNDQAWQDPSAFATVELGGLDDRTGE